MTLLLRLSGILPNSDLFLVLLSLLAYAASLAGFVILCAANFTRAKIAAPSAGALYFLARFAGYSSVWYYYKMTKAYWINYLYYTSYTTFEFLRLVCMTFTLTCLHELFGGGPTGGKSCLLPFPFEACAWTSRGIEAWKQADMAGVPIIPRLPTIPGDSTEGSETFAVEVEVLLRQA